jgi:hypothetical protein
VEEAEPKAVVEAKAVVVEEADAADGEDCCT